MPTLSVVMIVRDEANWLPACLESVRDIADTIVIGDTGSTDNSVDIARTYGAHVLDVPWTHDFAAARNAVLAQAPGDWLLHMDADENLDATGARAIRTLVNDDGCGADAVEVMLANYSDDIRAWRWVASPPNDPNARGRAGYIAVPLLRLFRNRRGFTYREPVHENITESVIAHGGVIGQAHQITIHHHGFGQGRPEKAARYLAIASAKTEQRPRDPKSWHDLAEQLVSMDRADDARVAAQKALALDPTHLGAATTLANLLLNAGELDAAKEVLDPFSIPHDAPPHVLVALSAIACRQGSPRDARALAERARALAPGNIMACFAAARACDISGDSQAAQSHLEAAGVVAPGISEVTDRIAALDDRTRGEALLAEGDAKSALAVFVAALKRDPEDPLTHLGIGEALKMLGDAARAQQSIDRALKLAPSLPGRPE